MKTIHVVGYKNSGKTTLIERWTHLLQRHHVRVAVLKHHGHSGDLAMPDEKTDSMRFFASGAASVVVAGDGVTQLNWKATPSFQTLKNLATISNPDVLFVEGFKQEAGAKIVLLRQLEDWVTLRNVSGIELVVGCPTLQLTVDQITSITQTEQLDQWMLNWMER